MSDQLKFLVLATGQPSKHLIKAIQKRGHTYEHHQPDNLYMYVSEVESGHDRIYDGRIDLEQPVRLKAKTYDAVISRLGSGLDYGATILQHLTENLDIYCPQTADGLLFARNKMRTSQRLSSEGIKVPLTVFAKNPVHVQFLIDKLGGLPAVGKLLSGSQGQGVMIFKDAEQTNTSLESFWKLQVDILLQRYIDSNKTDVRAIVVGDKISVAMERTGNKDFRANISQGGSGRKVTLSDQQKDLCIRAAKALRLEFAGVDLIKDKEGKSYIVEVNGNPGTKIIDITGHNYFDDLVAHIETKVGHQDEQNDEKQEEASIKPKPYQSMQALEQSINGIATSHQVAEFKRLLSNQNGNKLGNTSSEVHQVIQFISSYNNQRAFPKLVSVLNKWKFKK
ncbi:RimK family alpha-L-glutamate ligase [Larkinella bovis]|uniref:RimK family alpha-L-glutamate ligase n=1 Tax=Larkinella bovis TaxID=683041 RepID=A0ABW0I9F5_9BACT